MHIRPSRLVGTLTVTFLILALTGCSRSAPGVLGEAGWRDASQSSRLEAASLLSDTARASVRSSYQVVVSSAEGDIEISRRNGVTRYRFDAPRAGLPVPIEVFQYDPADSLHFPRSIVCGPDLGGVDRCRDVTLDVIGDYFTEKPLDDDFHGIAFSDIFSRTHVGVHSPAHWQTLAGLAHTPLNLMRSDESGMQRIGLEDRLYITATLSTEAGVADCVAWFDTEGDLTNGRPRGGWCLRDGVWFADLKGNVIRSLGETPLGWRFPAEVELPAVTHGLGKDAPLVARLTFSEFPEGFFDHLRAEPRLT